MEQKLLFCVFSFFTKDVCFKDVIHCNHSEHTGVVSRSPSALNYLSFSGVSLIFLFRVVRSPNMSGNVWFSGHAFKRSGLLLRVSFAIEVSFLALLGGLFKVFSWVWGSEMESHVCGAHCWWTRSAFRVRVLWANSLAIDTNIGWMRRALLWNICVHTRFSQTVQFC